MLLALIPLAAAVLRGAVRASIRTRSCSGSRSGAALALLAGALVIAGRWLVPQETKVEERPQLSATPSSVEQVPSRQRRALEGITRRRLLAGAAGAAGVGLTAAVVIPVVALGPGIEEQLRARRGTQGARWWTSRASRSSPRRSSKGAS